MDPSATATLRFQAGPLGIKLAERAADGSGYSTKVLRFNPLEDGSVGPAQQSGRVGIGDVIVGVGGQSVRWMDYDETVAVLKVAPRPVVISFCPPHGLNDAKPDGKPEDYVVYQQDLEEPLLEAGEKEQRVRPPSDGGFVQKRAYICPLILLGNVGMFAWTMYVNSQSSSREPPGPAPGAFGVFEAMSANPMWGPNTGVLYDFGAKDTAEIVRGGVPFRNNGTWRLFAAMWLHAGLIHLASNMYGLKQAGFPAEKAHGWWKILLIYMISGIMGNVISSIFLPTNITVGASGAVFGLFGAMWGDFVQNCGLYKGARCAQLVSLLFMTIINLGFGAVVPMIDNFAHLGGFVAGLLASLMLFARPRLKRRGDTKASQKCIASLAGVLLLVYVTAPVAMLFLVDDLRATATSWCSWCQLVTCVPVNRWVTWMPFNCNNDVSLCLGANATACDPAPCLQCPDLRILSTQGAGQCDGEGPGSTCPTGLCLQLCT